MLCKVPANADKKKFRSGDKTLPNFIKRKHPSKGVKKKQGGKDQLKSRQANSPKEAGHKELREPLSTEPSPPS
jgi:hypothetical protein